MRYSRDNTLIQWGWTAKVFFTICEPSTTFTDKFWVVNQFLDFFNIKFMVWFCQCAHFIAPVTTTRAITTSTRTLVSICHFLFLLGALE